MTTYDDLPTVPASVKTASDTARVPTTQVQEYASVETNDTDEENIKSRHNDNDNDDNDDELHDSDPLSPPRSAGRGGRNSNTSRGPLRRNRRRFRVPPGQGLLNVGSFLGGLYMLLIALFLILIIVVALGRSRVARPNGAAETNEDDWDRDATSGTTLTAAAAVKYAATLTASDTTNFVVQYDPTLSHLPKGSSMGSDNVWDNTKTTYLQPPLPWLASDVSGDDTDTTMTLGYLTQPHVSNNRLVFVSEGDVYYTELKSINNGADANANNLPAMKLTTTVGNVKSPHLVSGGVAYTATYTASREVYFMNLTASRRSPAQRITYWDSSMGVQNIVGVDDTHLLVATMSNAVSKPDVRLYQVSLLDPNEPIYPVPLAQAVEGVYRDNCIYFTRFRQPSRTIRYVGGTAESLWIYCDGQELAVPLTSDYNGTSKSPVVATVKDTNYLFFLSDRGGAEASEWKPTTMNLWAMPLPTEKDAYPDKSKNVQVTTPIQITHVSCQYNGKTLREYTMDSSTNNIVLRIGADLHILFADQLQKRLRQSVEKVDLSRLNIQVYSDFHEQQERLIKVKTVEHMTSADIFPTAFGTTNILMTLRGQAWVVPTIPSLEAHGKYQGGGQNLPPRRYRVAPGTLTGGSMRVLKAVTVPLWADKSSRRLAIVLATDPKSPTAEHAMYLVQIQSNATNVFSSLDNLPLPFLGGHEKGGSTKEGGLGSVLGDSLKVSPCGRRMAWTDTDGRICVMTIPLYKSDAEYVVLPKENELGEPMLGSLSELMWSPGGRYLSVQHNARNQFTIISIVDCGDPQGNEDGEMRDIEIGRIVQATPSRFNVRGMFWGKSSLDLFLEEKLKLVALLTKTLPPEDVASTLYFLSDGDIQTDVDSPWGSRAPQPYFPLKRSVYALPLPRKSVNGSLEDALLGRFSGGGALELFVDELNAFEKIVDLFSDSLLGASIMAAKSVEKNVDVRRKLKKEMRSFSSILKSRRMTRSHAATIARFLEDASTIATIANETIGNETSSITTSDFPKDIDIDFGGADLTFSRLAYRLVHIPKGFYFDLVSQTSDDGSLVIIKLEDSILQLEVHAIDSFPDDGIDIAPIVIPGHELGGYGLSTSREHLYFLFEPEGVVRIVSNTISSFSSFLSDANGDVDHNFADTSMMALSVWPALEYKQMYDDAWRMFRDYFWDRNMHGVDWPVVHERYRPLVQRCTKREELDDVLAQMAEELSALHVFVYGGEYNTPFIGENSLVALHKPASLGVGLVRSPEWKGYMITEMPQRDPDFNFIDDVEIFCPLSDQTLRITGQKGLAVGDVIVGINGESVVQFPHINMALRGLKGHSVRLEVLRLASGSTTNKTEAVVEAIITTPIGQDEADGLRYSAWEWKTQQTAKKLAAKAGFSVGYVHLQYMGSQDEDSFARNFYPDYDKQALILDLRHNGGGNIDSWIVTALQRKAWMYWQDRNGVRHGDIDWNQQFAFRGHVVVLIDEHSGSDAEGVSRGISELGLGRLVGKRTWGGGIWLSSDNRLVDGGIATAPEIGIYNERMNWGMGIEQQGVIPDVEVDNNPRPTFDGDDAQLERAIQVLKEWLEKEPVVFPKPPEQMPDLSLRNEECPV